MADSAEDETKPVCFRCTKAGFECLGYERLRLWRHTSTAPFPVTATEMVEDYRNEVVSAANHVTSPPAELSLVAFQGDFCFAFMFSNVVWRSYGAPWLDQAAQGKLGDLSLDATKALAQANFGRSNHKPDIELQGVVQYGKCLKSLAAELGKGMALAQGGQDLLVPILVLMMHAASHTDRTGAMFHLKGIARLLYICGPEAFQKQPYLNAFEAARATLLIAGLVGKQRLFFDDERWRTVPWARDPASKTPQSELLDILVILPGLLQKHAALEDTAHLEPRAILKILEEVQEQLVAVYKWRWRWQDENGDQVSVDIGKTWQPNGLAAPILGSIGTSRHLDRLRFGRFVAATELMLYNAALMWLLALLWKMDPIGAGEWIESCAAAAIPSDKNSWSVSFEPLRRPGAALTVRDPAMEVCRAFEWVSRHHSRSKDPTFLYLFPVGIAMSVLEKEPEGKTWVKALLDKSPVTANYSQGENPAGFGFYVTRESLHPELVQAKEQLFSPQEIVAAN
ncbi:Fc.00g004080.m01.CDS01 [Cosmosporella sp. VM-42]